jgi:hypothetical protein
MTPTQVVVAADAAHTAAVVFDLGGRFAEARLIQGPSPLIIIKKRCTLSAPVVIPPTQWVESRRCEQGLTALDGSLGPEARKIDFGSKSDMVDRGLRPETGPRLLMRPRDARMSGTIFTRARGRRRARDEKSEVRSQVRTAHAA